MFWKESTGFLVIVLVVLAGIIFLGHYNDVRYGNGQQETPIVNQEAQNSGN
ncbi:MAG: hypothetical protein HZA95_01435 [Candidatus Vogelbacteria bacterium]|nr:hypothetical protein [Candidatus Vogelbacteria bacterium]